MRTPAEADYGDLPRKVGYQLRRAQAASHELLIPLLASLGVAPGHYSILKIIALNPGHMQKDIAVLAGLDATTIVPIIGRFQKRGWISRERTAPDRRHVTIKITAEGKRALRQLDRRIARHEGILLQHLTEQERATLLELLTRISKVPLR